MPESLVYETQDGHAINETFWRRTIKGIPSRATQIFIRNLSDTRVFNGKVVVTPGGGQSFSEDAFVSENGETWSKSLDMSIAPLGRFELRARTVPMITPDDSTGRASLSIYGKWD